MKNKLLVYGMLAGLTISQLTGCGKKSDDGTNEAKITNETVDTSETTDTASTKEEALNTTEDNKNTTTESTTEVKSEINNADVIIYNDVLTRYYDLIANIDFTKEIDLGETGIYESIAYGGEADPLTRIGYTVCDLSGDGIPELVIGNIDREEGVKGNTILAVYTCMNGVPTFCFEGADRYKYYMLEDGQFYNLGSGGAMNSVYGCYSLSPDGTSLLGSDIYFSEEDPDNPGAMVFYHNVDEDIDIYTADKLDITDDEFFKINDDYLDKTVKIDFTPFSNFTPLASNAASSIHIDYEKDVTTNLEQYDEYIMDSSEYCTRVVFSSDTTLKDVKVLGLLYKDIDENGEIDYDVQEMYSQESLTKDKPLVVSLAIMGTIPNVGISYIDENGNEKRYAISMSGEDGSLLLLEF